MRKNTQKNTEFEVAKESINDEFNAAIQFKNSNKLKILLNKKGYNGTEADIGQLDAIIEVNKDIKSKNANLERLETEKKKLRDSLTNLNAQKKQNWKIEAENNKACKENWRT